MNLIRAIFCDNEGCIIPGKGMAFPLDALSQLRSYLKRFPTLAFAICTGRPVAYIEAIVQVLDLLDSHVPCVCEGGGILYWPALDVYETIATLSGTISLLQKLPEATYRKEPGKVACLSLYPNSPTTVQYLYDMLAQSPLAVQFDIRASAAAVDITPRGVNKATGLLVACERTSIPLSQVLCIGDALNDIPMLKAAGYSACPLNAKEDVKNIVDFVATKESTLGLLEILQHYESLFSFEVSEKS